MPGRGGRRGEGREAFRLTNIKSVLGLPVQRRAPRGGDERGGASGASDVVLIKLNERILSRENGQLCGAVKAAEVAVALGAHLQAFAGGSVQAANSSGLRFTETREARLLLKERSKQRIWRLSGGMKRTDGKNADFKRFRHAAKLRISICMTGVLMQKLTFQSGSFLRAFRRGSLKRRLMKALLSSMCSISVDQRLFMWLRSLKSHM